METMEVQQDSKKKVSKVVPLAVTASLLLGIGGGFAIGRYATPPEIVTETKTVNVVPSACQQTLLSMHELIKKREEQVKNLDTWAEILKGSRDYDMPTVVAFKTLFIEQTADLSQKVDANLTSCNSYL